MNRRVRTGAAVVLACAALLATASAGCKKSEKGEARAWDRALSEVDGLAVTYPGFKGALEEQRRLATAAMEQARALADEKQRIEAMSSANKLLSSGFVGDLRRIDRDLAEVRKGLVSLAGKAGTPEERAAAEQASRLAERSLAEVEAILRRGAPDASSATGVLSQAQRRFADAKDVLSQVERQIDGRKRDEKASADEQARQEAGEKAEEEARQAPWTCEYCQHANAQGVTACDNCGASRP